MDEFNFKKFENTHQRLEKRITITGTFSIGFPSQFYNDNHIKEFKYIVIYYDAEKRALGIHFTNSEEEKGRFTVIHSKKGYGGQAVARSFFKANNIDVKRFKGRYDWEKKTLEGVGELYVIVLKERDQKDTGLTSNESANNI